MTSRKRHTTSKSGNSGTSPKTGTSSQKGRSSKTAPASFVEIFGATDSAKVQSLKKQLAHQERQIADMQATGEPTLALYRSRHRARLARLQRMAEQLQEAIEYETGH